MEWANVFSSTFIIISIALSWAIATQFTKSAMTIDSEHFFAPYSIIWINTSAMTICYPFFLFFSLFSGQKNVIKTHRLVMKEITLKRITPIRILPFLFLWIGANYSFGQSLGRLSASAAASLMSSNTAMVCLLSLFILKETLTAEKVLSVVLAIAGVIVISLDKEFVGDFIGVSLVMLSAIFAAIYKVFFKRINGNSTLSEVSYFMSVLGLCNIFLNIIPTVVMVLSEIDHIEWTFVPFWALIGSALLGLSYNFLVSLGISYFDPLVISIGALFGIPLSTLMDIFFRGMQLTSTFVVGTLLILLSYVLNAFPIRQLFQNTVKERASTNDVEIPLQMQ